VNVISIFDDRRFSAAWFQSYASILLGSLIMAAGYVFFVVPHKIIPGGVYGIAITLHYLFASLPVGVTALVLNLPLIAWGIHELGPRFGVKTVTGILLTSLNVDLLGWVMGHFSLAGLAQPIAATGLLPADRLVSCVFGGVCVGTGLALIFRAKATTGGSDIVSNILYKRTRFPIGQTIILLDALVVCIGAWAAGDPTSVAYSIIVIFVTGRAVDAILDGLRYQKAVFIISARHEEVQEVILRTLRRGGTLLEGAGLFGGERRPVIFSAVSRRELALLQEHVQRIDPQAFITVIDAREILGRGFSPLVDKG